MTDHMTRFRSSPLFGPIAIAALSLVAGGAALVIAKHLGV